MKPAQEEEDVFGAMPQPPPASTTGRGESSASRAEEAERSERGETEKDSGAGTLGLLDLPDQLLESFLELLPLDERLRCEAVCTEFRSRVQEANGLWREVDMSRVPARKRRNLTDAALERLLRHGAGRPPPPHSGLGGGEAQRPAPTVQHLHLQGCTRLTAAAVRLVTACPALRTLHLHGACMVSVADCAALGAMQHLQRCHVDLLVEPHQVCLATTLLLLLPSRPGNESSRFETR